jgi:molecular chaperone HtpG
MVEIMGERPTPSGYDGMTYEVGLHLPGILRLLSEHLYADPRVVLRELIQNAHDSCQRHRIEASASPIDYQPAIDVRIDETERTLSILDNGAGLTQTEIHDFLATIGRGYTEELRQKLKIGEPDGATALIGRFGLGLLSAFTVASRIEVVTRSIFPGEPAWQWTSDGGPTYRLTPAERDLPGTTVTLHLKVDGEFLLNPGIVKTAIQTFADFLPIPITVNNGPEPVNSIDPPWAAGAEPEALRRYVTERFGVEVPLAIIPLRDEQDAGGLDGLPIRGVLFIPPRSTLSIHEFGSVTLYVRRMYVTDEEHDLLPRWARFVGGVIDTPALNPTASREQVRCDSNYRRVQAALEDQLLYYLTTLAAENPAAWQYIVAAHNDLIKVWALESHTFFEAVCDLVTFETSRGRLNLPDILLASGNTLYYYVDERGALQEKLLFDSRGLIAIDASHFAEESFLQAYAQVRPSVSLQQIEVGASFVFDEADGDDPHWTPIISYYEEQGIPVRLAAFQPEGIPALLVYPPGSDETAEARSALESGRVSGAVADLIQAYLDLHDPLDSASLGTLYLNVSNSLIAYLATLPPESGALTAALEILYQNARVLAGRKLTPREARESFDLITYSVEQIVRELYEDG